MGLPLINRRRRVSHIGLDVGQCGLRTTQLLRRQECWNLARTGRVDRPRRTGDEASSAPVSADLVRRATRQSSFGGRKVVACLSPKDVEYHSLSLPPALLDGAREQVAQAAQFEVSHLMTMDDDRAQICHWLLPAAMGEMANAMGIAARHDSCTEHHELISRAGFHCIALDADACALSRFGSLLKPRGENAVWGVLDLGATATRLVVCVGDTPVLVREVGPGGAQWNGALAEALHISEAAAEVHKKDHGIALSSRGVRQGESTVPAGELAGIVFGVLRADLKKLAGQIKRSYEYVLSRFPQGKAEDLVMVGSGALMPNLDQYLADTLGIVARRASAYIGEPSCRLQCSLSKRDTLEEFAMSVGLALWPEHAA